MMRSALCMAMLAMCLVALQCTASNPGPEVDPLVPTEGTTAPVAAVVAAPRVDGEEVKEDKGEPVVEVEKKVADDVNVGDPQSSNGGPGVPPGPPPPSGHSGPPGAAGGEDEGHGSAGGGDKSQGSAGGVPGGGVPPAGSPSLGGATGAGLVPAAGLEGTVPAGPGASATGDDRGKGSADGKENRVEEEGVVDKGGEDAALVNPHTAGGGGGSGGGGSLTSSSTSSSSTSSLGGDAGRSSTVTGSGVGTGSGAGTEKASISGVDSAATTTTAKAVTHDAQEELPSTEEHRGSSGPKGHKQPPIKSTAPQNPAAKPTGSQTTAPASTVQAFKSTTSTAAPTASKETSVTSTTESAKVQFNTPAPPLPKLSTSLQSLDNKDGSIGSVSLFALTTLATLAVVVVLPAL